LKHFELFNFGIGNWRSTIRNEVRVHPRCRDIEPWNGSETADIVYRDEGDSSSLHAILEEAGYGFPDLPPGSPGPRTFYIEVKTTTGGCWDTFYMSGAQYQRVSAHSLVWKADIEAKTIASQMQRGDPLNVYVLFRVFNIDQARVGLKIFVDPEAARQRGELNFTVDTWAVRTT
jgi:hypothetical protein